MTRASSKALDPSDYYDELPAALWKPTILPRLPSDAPAELKKYTIDLNDPKKVYVLHRAQRRHGFQDLVQRFENQLVYGCQATFCDTPTCFTCARRVAGKAPIRRFNDTSARTLACYLASQDNPERSLCHNPSAAPLERSGVYKRIVSKSRTVRRDPQSPTYAGPLARKQSDETSLGQEMARPDISDNQDAAHRDKCRLGRAERSILLAERIDQLREPKKTDSKSFIQSLYGTVTLKMLDWLSPQSLYALSSPECTSKSSQNDTNGADVLHDSQPVANINAPNVDVQITRSSSTEQKSAASMQSDHVLPSRQENRREMTFDCGKTEPNTPEIVPQPQPPMLPSKSGAIIVPSHPATSNGQAELRDSDVLSKLPQEKSIKPSLSKRRSVKKPHRLSASRQVSSIVDLNVGREPREADLIKEDEVDLSKQSSETLKLEEEANGTDSVKKPTLDSRENETGAAENQHFQPQTLSLMTPEIVELFCNFMQEHDLCETHDLFPTAIDTNLRRARRDVLPIQFPADTGIRCLSTETNSSKIAWKKFIEQSFFYVLSNPDQLLRSFMTEQGNLMDSLSMWYIMVRLTRVSPTLVFDSLWMSSSRLFSPPKELQSRHCWIPKSIPSTDSEAFGPCQSDEAAHLVLIYLHALTAAMPLKWENKLGAKACSGSRIFSGERRAIARELSPGVYRRRLRYYDAYNNESALRLARRLFRGISSVLRYEELTSIERGEHIPESQGHFAFFDVLLGYIESSQFPREYPADTLLDFSHEYSNPEPMATYHDLSRQMVGWARTVLLQEWKGEVEVSNDGVFGGALAFMSAMHRNQERVALNDSDFVVEHFAGRLSSTEVPVEWLTFTPNRKTLHLLDHPYLFKASSLVDYFRSINLHRMRKAYETAINFNTRTGVVMAPGRLMTDSNHRQHLLERLRTALNRYLVLEIRRDKVLQDAFDQLWRREVRELLRPFKVRLGESLGEEGFDLGGVQQEFFRLAIAEALDPNYGTFSVDERTKMTWLVPGSLTPLWRCELIGLIVSLAVYNGLTLPVTFPLAMYRKLLGIENTEIEHIEDGWPDLAKGLTALLEWDEGMDGNVADVFARTYEFSVESFGEQVSRDMSEWSSWPQFGTKKMTNPKDAPFVDSSNRKAYVTDYIRWLTDISIRPQFEAFKTGFYTCLDRRSLSLLEPRILQTVVEGVQEIDISELRRNTRYVGWSASNRTVRDFWSIVKRYDMEQKKKLLEFVTASDRVPVGGMQGLHFVLQKNGTGDSRLPTSYTCFATLLLPEYDNKEVLGEKLEIAINNAKGFGFA